MDRELCVDLHLPNNSNLVSDTIVTTDTILNSFGLLLGESSTLLLFDPEMEADFDIESALDIGNVLRRMESWPLLGVVSYEYGDFLVDVSYEKKNENEYIHCISFSFPEEIYQSKKHLENIKALTLQLHQKLGAVRSLSDINIDDNSGFSIENNMVGECWLDIIDRSYYAEDVGLLKKIPGVSVELLQDDVLVERKKEYIAGD